MEGPFDFEQILTQNANNAAQQILRPAFEGSFVEALVGLLVRAHEGHFVPGPGGH